MQNLLSSKIRFYLTIDFLLLKLEYQNSLFFLASINVSHATLSKAVVMSRIICYNIKNIVF